MTSATRCAVAAVFLILIAMPGCSKTPEDSAATEAARSETGVLRAELSRDEEVQLLLLRRMLKDARLPQGETAYVSVDADLHRINANPRSPSDAVMQRLGDNTFSILPFTQYLSDIGGYAGWQTAGELTYVYWVSLLKWVDEDAVEVTAGRHLGPLESSGEQLRLRWKDEQWQIETVGGWKS